MYKASKKLWKLKLLVFGGGFSVFVIWRFNEIFREYEKAVVKE
jgi:hypothetical protein